jgi:hypothetical protein
MNPLYKKLWVDALRSGKYEQGKTHLYEFDPKNPNTKPHCCAMGVLLDVMNWPYRNGSYVTGVRFYENPRRGFGSPSLFPNAASKEAGFAEDTMFGPKLTYVVQDFVSTMSDNGVPFKVLADLIEEQL